MLLCLVACGDAASPGMHTTRPAPVTAGTTATRTDVTPPPVRGKAVGAPHGAAITELVLSVDGRAALTVDARGGMRLWPDLDSDDPAVAEPRVVPGAAPRRVSVGGTDDAHLVAYIDAAGAGHLLALDRSGTWRERVATSPADLLLQLEVLADGRLLGLGADRVIRLLSSSGAELARVDRPLFRPGELHVGRDGRRALAVTVDADEQSRALDLTAQRLAIGADSITLVGDEVSLDDIAPPFAVAPTADAIAAFADRGGTRELVVAELAGGGTPVPLNPAHEAATAQRLEFVGPRELFVEHSAGPNHLVAAATDRVLPRPSLRFANGQTSPLGTRDNRVVIASGSWLFVQRPRQGTHAYLGYAPFQPNAGAVSPSAERAAWVAGGHIYVEPTRADAGADTVRLPAAQPGVYRIGFLDDAHLLLFDSQGGMRIVDAVTGAAIAAVDGGGVPRWFDIDRERRRIVVVPGSGVPHIFAYDASFAVSGPVLVPVAATSAGFQNGTPELWTADGLKLRGFRLAELADGTPPADSQERGTPHGLTGPVAADRQGRVYGVDPTSNTVTVRGPDAGPRGEATIAVPSGVAVYRVLPSPDGTRVALHLSSQVIAMYAISGRELWSRPADRSVTDMAWSPDGKLLLTTGTAGAGLWNAGDGAPARLRCGVWFERSVVAPVSTHTGANEAPLCE